MSIDDTYLTPSILPYQTPYKIPLTYTYEIPVGTLYEGKVLNQWVYPAGEWFDKLVPNKENNTMTEFNMEKSQREFAYAQLSSIYYDKESELRRTYGMDNDPTPYTAKDLINRIKSGKYILQEDNGRFTDNHWERTIIWRDPNVKKDREAFEAALDKFDLYTRKVKSKIQFAPISDLLGILDEYEAYDTTTK